MPQAHPAGPCNQMVYKKVCTSPWVCRMYRQAAMHLPILVSSISQTEQPLRAVAQRRSQAIMKHANASCACASKALFGFWLSSHLDLLLSLAGLADRPTRLHAAGPGHFLAATICTHLDCIPGHPRCATAQLQIARSNRSWHCRKSGVSCAACWLPTLCEAHLLALLLSSSLL